MTDKEIIQALECCLVDGCDICSCREEADCVRAMAENALDLINGQQREIERLKILYNGLDENFKLTVKKFYCLGIVEFAEKLKDRTYPIGCFISAGDKFVIGIEYIDELVKEMVGADNG
ncbi:MAG: hypothetical protein IKY90_08900 [Oscillospiraceae bacterium]|nr:hypothetical protein [Oscillospiraceae bacterium]